jgi:hypothetical protein
MEQGEDTGMSGLQHDELQCRILSLECEFGRKEVWLQFPEGDCCDMNGCIAFVTRIWSGFERIYTRSGARPDTAYFRHEDTWKAMLHRDGEYIVFE